MSGEFAWIERFFRPLAAASGASLNLSDDAALLAPPAGRDLVLTADCLNAGVHFFPDDDPEGIARKLLRVNLSDLAAMGARPLGYLVTLALPAAVDEDWLAAFARGLAADQECFAIALLGGDTTRTKGPLSLSLTAIGSVPAGRALRRSGARAGEEIWVSGSIGDAAAGLKLLTSGGAAPGYLVERYHLPEPRTALGVALLEGGLAAAAVDVSDGLVADLRHLAEASGLSAEVALEAVPLSPELRSLVEAGGITPVEPLAGGDDYELLFSAAPEVAAQVLRLAEEIGLPVTRIGRLQAGPAGVEVRDRDGRLLVLPSEGWEHL